VLIALAVLAGCGGEEQQEETVVQRVLDPDHVVALGRIEPRARMVDLTSEIAGRVEAVRLGAGDRAAVGDTILALVRGTEKAALAQAAAGVAARTADVEGSEASLAAARSRLERAESEYRRMEELFDAGTEPESSYEAALTEFETVTQDVRRLEAAHRTALAALEQARADSARARAALERRLLTAPADGRLLSLDVAPGDVMSPEMVYGAFAIESPTVARCEVDELYAHLVTVGRPAVVRFQGSGDTLTTGSVLDIGPYLRRKSLFSEDVGELEDRRVREVVVSLSDTTRVLLGARVECVIELE
jgi:multidrug efflux pump subunit AcrA (membrane-fusion protein)